jgi:hypothetical protein
MDRHGDMEEGSRVPFRDHRARAAARLRLTEETLETANSSHVQLNRKVFERRLSARRHADCIQDLIGLSNYVEIPWTWHMTHQADPNADPWISVVTNQPPTDRHADGAPSAECSLSGCCLVPISACLGAMFRPGIYVQSLNVRPSSSCSKDQS